MKQTILFSLIILFFSAGQASESFYILKDDSKNFVSLSKKINAFGGQTLRKMKATNALVAQLDEKTVAKLKKIFPNLIIRLDEKIFLTPYSVEKTGITGQVTQELPYGIEDVKAIEAHDLGHRGAGVNVCIIDTGIDTDHKDLKFDAKKSLNLTAKKVDGKLVIDPLDFEDKDGHGTHVAGTIAGLDNGIGVVGVAPEANIIAMRVFGGDGGTTYSTVTDAVTACKDAGAHVINMSLGGYAVADKVCDDSDSAQCLFKEAVDDAVDNGIVVVVAAGNSSGDIKNYIPAGFDSVIAVSAVNSSSKFAGFSNYGLEDGHYAAPGVNTLSTWSNGKYRKISGTSMASPHVAGVAALMVSSKSMGLRADKISGLDDSEQGDGMINALETVKYQ